MDVPEQLIRPEDWWPVDPHWQERYDRMVGIGRRTAAQLDACVVMICRNSMPHLANTIGLLRELSLGFRSMSIYVHENDSTDGTGEFLDVVADESFSMTVCHETLGGIDARGFGRERTERLAYCRNKCLGWVSENASRTAWTIVLDSDAHGGWSVDGVFNSIGCLGSHNTRPDSFPAGGMASYGVYRPRRLVPEAAGIGEHGILQYDAWAARLNDWRDRREEVGFNWFFCLLPPVGSPPIEFLSAFGGLAVYRTDAFLAGGYTGDDCEHVGHHRNMRAAGYSMHLNPGCRYVAY